MLFARGPESLVWMVGAFGSFLQTMRASLADEAVFGWAGAAGCVVVVKLLVETVLCILYSEIVDRLRELTAACTCTVAEPNSVST